MNTVKSGLLIPQGAPLPTDEIKERFPPGFDFQLEGFRIAGSPVGTTEFMSRFAERKLSEAVAKLQAIKALGSKDARVSHRLLTCSGIKLM